jgi:hypothetical protein
MLLALAAAPVAESGSGARAEARVTVTIIQRTMALRNGEPERRASDIAPVRQKPRDCSPADKPAPDCRLIVYDLP